MSEIPKRIYEDPDDFEASIRIYREDEGGRVTPPYNGVRWDFAYEGDNIYKTGIYMIWPDFIDEHGDSLPSDAPLPIDQELSARMIIAVDKMREELHRSRISEGVRFFCHEGPRCVAEGVVTKVTGLHKAR